MQTKAKAMAHDLLAEEHFGKYVSHYIVGWAVYHVDCPARNDLSNKVEVYVDVLRVCVIVVIHCKFKCCLVVTEQHRLGMQ